MTTPSPTIRLNNGVEIPALGLGVFQSPPAETAAAVESALKTGYRLIDTAAAYANEREVGEGIRRSGIPGDEIFIETKVWISDFGYDTTLHAFEKSARKQRALQQAHAKHGIATQAWSPIGGITSYRGMSKKSFEDPTLLALAGKYGKSAAQVMLRWHLQEGRSAIPKSVKPARIAENFDVLDFELTRDEVAAIDALETGVRGGPEPESITLAAYGRPIPEA